VILTKTELTALTEVSSSTSSWSKKKKQRIRREQRDREAHSLSKHIGISEKQPESLLSLTQIRKRAEDLNKYLAHNGTTEYHEYYDTPGNERLPEAKVYLPQEVEADAARLQASVSIHYPNFTRF
jgi:hypothetical protein